MSNNESKEAQPNRVTFAESTPETIATSPTVAEENVWYSIQDYDNFQQAASTEARRIGNQLAASTREQRRSLNDNDYIECIGIEKFLSQDLQQEMTTRKQIHINSVIASQRFWNTDMLAYISESGSQWAREKAHEFAMMYTELSRHLLPSSLNTSNQQTNQNDHAPR